MSKAERILTAIRAYEHRCYEREKAKSLLMFGHTGAWISSERPTDAGRIVAIESVIGR